MTTTQYENETDANKGRVAAATDKVKEKANALGRSASDTLDTARAKASEALGAARDKTSAAYDSARDGATRATRRTADGIDANPLGALVGGLALGALVAAVLPRTRREQEALGDYGRRINETAKEAARAAKEAGKGKLDELGLNADAAKEKLGALASSAGEAVKTSATAAAQTVKGTPAPQ